MQNQLHMAKANRSDEFYTQYKDIEKEVKSYYGFDKNIFKDKVILLPCDDAKYSNFTKYFVDNFNVYGIKKIISTSYNNSAESQKGTIFIMERHNNQNVNKIYDLEGNGDFNSEEITNLRDEADIIITNPPFSQFRNFFKWIMNGNKKFLCIANINCITYKEIFPYIQNNEIWLGTGLGRWISGFIVPECYELYGSEARIDNDGQRIVSTNNCLWLTNLEHMKRHEEIQLMTMRDNLLFNEKLKKCLIKRYNCLEYPHYDNYDAIEVPFTEAIPSDYNGDMGVPITFLDKYNPNQFEIVKFRKGNDDKDLSINGKSPYFRIVIRRKARV